MGKTIGIDLGTTNSACAVWEGNEARIIPNAHGDKLTPSVVAVDDDGSMLVGKAAKQAGMKIVGFVHWELAKE